ncbi:hypothetical protein ABUW04_24705 [Streptacidiphilus sp. N1-10]|uniref:Uncharacterized protein n=1 Tax=Streptacidiphilus jeojiensis TaxID=3229225 RepID=A0ABV6XTA6_9ACTN
MSDQTDLGKGGYEIRPFSEDWPDEIKRLRDEVVAVLHKISPFYMAPPDPDDVALEGKVTALVAPYGLKENERHSTITDAVATVGEQIQNFAASRNDMGHKYIWSAPAITMKLDGVLLTGTLEAMGDFRNYLRATANRFADMTGGETRKQLQDLVQSQPIDSTTRVLVEQYALVCGLAGRMIDAGNAFLNLDAQLRVALEFYAEGRAPQGWWDKLPAPLRSVFDEGTWVIIDESLRIAAEHGLGGALGPFTSIPVAVTRTVLTIRKEREHEKRKFRRDDVDELLDLADQLTKANDVANELGRSIDAIVLASRFA